MSEATCLTLTLMANRCLSVFGPIYNGFVTSKTPVQCMRIKSDTTYTALLVDMQLVICGRIDSGESVISTAPPPPLLLRWETTEAATGLGSGRRFSGGGGLRR